MASIHSFMPRPATGERRPRPVGQTATIIIFPGVRYERPGGPSAGGSGSGSQSRKPVGARR
jgi:hypothetical protein